MTIEITNKELCIKEIKAIYGSNCRMGAGQTWICNIGDSSDQTTHPYPGVVNYMSQEAYDAYVTCMGQVD